MRVALIEYGIGNVRSVENALVRVGAEPEIVRDGDAMRASKAPCVVMPGVGAVGEALVLLRERGLEAALRQEVISRGLPFLGICVGMQVMAERCEEFGEHKGFGWIPGSVRRIEAEGQSLRVPHVGWNTIALCGEGGFLAGLEGEHFYFVHSYWLDCPADYVIARTDYGRPITAAVRRGQIMGVQFHPEKSSVAGAALLRGFLARVTALAASAAA